MKIYYRLSYNLIDIADNSMEIILRNAFSFLPSEGSYILINVTDICIEKLLRNNVISIPSGDRIREHYFKVPTFNITKNICAPKTIITVSKSIIIVHNDDITEYDENTELKINILDNAITTRTKNDINDKLINIHSKLKINYGSFNDELPEQKMVVRYLTGKEKVLEIGGNIGRNSLVIASILEKNNLVTLESDSDIAIQLIENRDLNNFDFHIECSALSNRKLIQRGWDTMPSNTLIDGYNWVNTITLNELKNKYQIEFDTLVLDCEGAFYYILMDMPEILNNINLIIMENDYWDITKKTYIDDILLKNNFYVDYVECGGWGPCYNNFFEVWKK